MMGSSSAISFMNVISGDVVTPHRESRPKTRTGCFVCKIRRVKCDETKPNCLKCMSTGRKCEGYPDILPRKSKKGNRCRMKNIGPPAASAISCMPPLDISGSANVRRSFHFIRTSEVGRKPVPGNFEPFLWNYTILQLCHNYDTVQQSIVALSAILEIRAQIDPETTSSSMSSELLRSNALIQYNKAVRLLINFISSHSNDSFVVLVSCLIFMWIEFLRGDLVSAFGHLNSGTKLLMDLRRLRVGIREKQGEDSEDIYDPLDRSFSRLRIQAAMHNSLIADVKTCANIAPIETPVSVPPSTVLSFEATQWFDKKTNTLITQIPVMEPATEPRSAESDRKIKIRLDCMHTWERATHIATESPEIVNRGYYSIRIYNTLVNLLVKCLYSGSEMIYDKHTADFGELLTLCESLLNVREEEGPGVRFHMSIFPPLFFIAVKCRLLRIRQKAVYLMKCGPEQEGRWSRENVIRYSEWKIYLEEQARGDVPESEMLPHSARLYQDHRVGNDNENGFNLLTSFRRGPTVGNETEVLVLDDDPRLIKAMCEMGMTARIFSGVGTMSPY